MTLKWRAAILRAPDQFCYFMLFFTLIWTFLLHNISAVISDDQKQFLDIRIAITNLNLDEDFYFNKLAAVDVLLIADQALIPVPRKRNRLRKRGKRAGPLSRLHHWENKPPLPSVLLANVQSLENKLDELRSRPSNQRELNNCNILCFLKSWLNKDLTNIHYRSKVLEHLLN
jgi:hypothetical protein